MGFPRHFFLLATFWALPLINSCCKNANESAHRLNSASTSLAGASRLLVLGDVQLNSNLYDKVRESEDGKQLEIAVDDWNELSIDYSIFSTRLKLSEILDRHQPTEILQSGDMVESDNAYSLDLLDQSSNSIERLQAPYDEWDVLKHLPQDIPIFPALGNHEFYHVVSFPGIFFDNRSKARFNTDDYIFEFHPPHVRQELLKRHYSHLVDQAEFKFSSATYTTDQPQYCLLSFDGAEIDEDNIQSFFKFASTRLKKCQSKSLPNQFKPIIVMNHYPLFSAKKKDHHIDQDIARMLIEFFNHLEISLMIAGHEHVYVRYSNSYLKEIGFSDWPTPNFPSVTMGTFGREPRTIPASKARYSLSGTSLGGNSLSGNSLSGNSSDEKRVKDYQVFEGYTYGIIDFGQMKPALEVYGLEAHHSQGNNGNSWKLIDTIQMNIH